MPTLAEINYGWPNSCPQLQNLLKKTDPTTPWAKLHRAAVAYSRVSDSNGNLRKDLIRQILDQGPLIIDCSSDPFNGGERTVVKNLQAYVKDFTVLSGDAGYLSNPQEHICYFPYFFLCIFSLPLHQDQVVINPSRKYVLSCLNGRNRLHRIENWLKIKDKPWFDRCMFSLHQGFDLEIERNESCSDFADPGMLDRFLDFLPRLPYRTDKNDLTARHPAYWNCYVNLVTETSVKSNELWMSEKTFKPLLSGQMALWLSNPGIVVLLRNIGFDVFDDYIDHGYDSAENWHVRIDLIHAQIDRIMNYDLEKHFVDTESRRLYNKHLLFSAELYDRLTQQCTYYAGLIK